MTSLKEKRRQGWCEHRWILEPVASEFSSGRCVLCGEIAFRGDRRHCNIFTGDLDVDPVTGRKRLTAGEQNRRNNGYWKRKNAKRKAEAKKE